ncbi:MAG: hypothetical protein LIP23_01610, partial [Planctomycetes bacterium]|nr:hypothetical protein [Planctomycetota bacterium]
MADYDVKDGLTAFYTRDEGELEHAANEAQRINGFLIDRGSPIPLGPDRTARGVNFAVVAGHATGMKLVLFEGDDDAAKAEIRLDPRLNRTGDVWHVRVLHHEPDLLRSLRYVWKADGPTDAARGLYYDADRPLLDPYARAYSGVQAWGRPDLPHPEFRDGPVLNLRRCRIAPTRSFDWGDEAPLLTPIEDTIIYELHVRGFTIDPSAQV